MGRKILTTRAFWVAALVLALAGIGIMSAKLASAGSAGSKPVCASGEEQVPVEVALRGVDQPVCLPVGGSGLGASRIDDRYGEAVDTLIAGYGDLLDQTSGVAFEGDASVSISVVCWDRDDWKQIGELFAARGNETVGRAWGFVSSPHAVVNLSPGVCEKLDALAYDGEREEKMSTSSPVRTLIHEAIHTTGILDEGHTECFATQLTTALTLELGGSRAYGDRLTALNQEMDSTSRAGSIYDSPECFSGGPLDLELPGAVWS